MTRDQRVRAVLFHLVRDVKHRCETLTAVPVNIGEVFSQELIEKAVTRLRQGENVPDPAARILELAARHTPGTDHSKLPFDFDEWCLDTSHECGAATLKLECPIAIANILVGREHRIDHSRPRLKVGS